MSAVSPHVPGQAARFKTLLAGFGNELRGDDGFGIVVLGALRERLGEREEIDFLEVGTGGVRLAQALLTPYARLIVVDAMYGDGPPGTVYVKAVESVERARSIDMHMATPSRALALAASMGVVPQSVYLVGCEPEFVDELTMELTPIVQAAVGRAIEQVLEVLSLPQHVEASDP